MEVETDGMVGTETPKKETLKRKQSSFSGLNMFFHQILQALLQCVR